MDQQQDPSLLELQVDYDAGNILKDATRWSRFIAIVGMVSVSIFILVILFAGTAMVTLFDKLMPGMGEYPAMVIVIFVVVFIIIGFMAFLIYRFSTQIRKAIETQDQELFGRGLNTMRIYFIIAGVFAILGLISNVSNLIKL